MDVPGSLSDFFIRPFDLYTSVKPEILLRIFGFILILYCLIRFLGLRSGKRRYNLPPGPTGLPIVGYLPFLTKAPHVKLNELRKKYGNVFSLYFGRQLVIILGDVESLRETFGKDEYHGRPSENLLCPGAFKKNIANVNGKDWVEQRKLVFQGLKAVGKGNEFVENIVQSELDRFLKYVENFKGNPFDIKLITSVCASNIITKLTWGEQYDLEDETWNLMYDFVQDFIEHSDMTMSQQYFPWLLRTPIIKKYGRWDKYFEKTKKLREFFEKTIDEHQKTLDPKNPRNYIDACLIQSTKSLSCDRETLIGGLLIMVVAGGETVRTSLHWAFLALIAYPEIQSKLQKEVDDVIGRERKPVWADQKDMPYTMSFLMEIQRYYTIVPLNVYRYTVEDTKVGKYDVPKGTYVISNLWNVLHDPDYWEQPEKLIPDRFIDETGRGIVKPKSYLPFSYGKRICPGENLANVEMFLFLTTTVQKYNLKSPGGAKIDLTPEYFVTTQPQEQDMCLIPRTTK